MFLLEANPLYKLISVIMGDWEMFLSEANPLYKLISVPMGDWEMFLLEANRLWVFLIVWTGTLFPKELIISLLVEITTVLLPQAYGHRRYLSLSVIVVATIIIIIIIIIYWLIDRSQSVAGINSRNINEASWGLTSRKGGLELVRLLICKTN
jgi:hypothetical protein